MATFAIDISDLFVKFFSSLAAQTPIIATLLSLIYNENKTFPKLVFEKLCENLSFALVDDNVIVSKLNMRAMACLVSSGTIQLCGERSFLTFIQLLLKLCNESISTQPNPSAFDMKVQIAVYLLATSIPWYAATLCKRITSENNETLIVLETLHTIFNYFCANWRSIFDLTGTCSIFHMNVLNNAENPTGGPENATCWDELWTACNVAKHVVEEALAGTYSPPSCLCMVWNLLEGELPSTASRIPEQVEFINSDETASAPTDSGPLLFTASILEGLQTAISRMGSDANTQRFRSLSEDSHYPFNNHWQRLYYPVFDLESAPGAADLLSLPPLEKYHLIDTYHNTLHFFEPVIRHDGTRVGSLELLCKHLVGARKLFAEELNVEFCLVEILLLRLVQVPPLRYPQTYRVIYELCKMVPPFAAALATGK